MYKKRANKFEEVETSEDDPNRWYKEIWVLEEDGSKYKGSWMRYSDHGWKKQGRGV